MSSRMIHNGEHHPFPGGLKAIIISCDHATCDKSLNDHQIADGGGLKTMGWQLLPLDCKVHHYCPDHRRSE
jgi:hypothetical protein